MKKLFKSFCTTLLSIVLALGLVFNGIPLAPTWAVVVDEAKLAGRTAKSLPSSEDDYLQDMDNGITKDPEKVRLALDPYVPGISAEEAVKAVVRGRNNWTIWTAGNDRLWDKLAKSSVGSLDLLKTLSSHETLPNKRSNRWKYLGLVNEPCFKEAKGPRADRYGLWLDERIESKECPADPFEDETKYPGVKVGARGKDGLPVGSYYGYASGIVGLRVFPNPDFDADAQKKWDPERYYTDASYYNNKDLVKPYRVGMSCAFCHVGPNPTKPPINFNEPQWQNLSSNVGAQYFWVDRIIQHKPDEASFAYQLMHTSRPGALDTSLVSSDQINNPRTMNAVYQLGARLKMAQKWGQEKLTGGELNNKQFNDYVKPDGPLPTNSPLKELYNKPNVITPRVLKDGADSVGALGALNRVYVNIGLFSEEWLRHFIPLLGGPKMSPFSIATAEKNSVYWQANTNQTPDLGLFFLAATPPDHLKDAPEGKSYLSQDSKVLEKGKVVFANNCARCHSSKLPEKAFANFFPNKGAVDANYLEAWNAYWQWTKTDEFKQEMRKIVLEPDFLDDNFLSTDLRIPVTLLETNANSTLATNGIAGNIWNDFTSSSYKSLPSVGSITVHDPYTFEPREYKMPAGGRGYTRPPSLVSLWSTAPYLLNNTLGNFEWEGTTEARMKSFSTGITELLWPEKRKGNGEFITASGKKAPGWIDRTTATSYLKIPSGFLPDFLQPKLYFLRILFPNLISDEGLTLGPIPKGTPINLLSNIDLSQKDKLARLAPRLIADLKKLPANATDADAQKVFANVAQPLLAANKSPDFVVNRGHYFGTDFLPESEGEKPLTDEEKASLIEFLKTL